MNAAQLKPATIVFSDKPSGDAPDANLDLVRFDDWTTKRPVEKKFLALFPSYSEPAIVRVESGKSEDGAKPEVQKLYIYVAQARFALDRAPATIDLSRYVALDFLSRIDPAIKHKLITAADVVPFTDEAGAGNQNPDRKWCTGRQALICLQSTYALEGKIPLGITWSTSFATPQRRLRTTSTFRASLHSLLRPISINPDCSN